MLLVYPNKYLLFFGYFFECMHDTFYTVTRHSNSSDQDVLLHQQASLNEPSRFIQAHRSCFSVFWWNHQSHCVRCASAFAGYLFSFDRDTHTRHPRNSRTSRRVASISIEVVRKSLILVRWIREPTNYSIAFYGTYPCTRCNAPSYRRYVHSIQQFLPLTPTPRFGEKELTSWRQEPSITRAIKDRPASRTIKDNYYLYCATNCYTR